jgi:hypothetical protein
MTLGHQEQVKIVIEDALGFLIPGPRTSLTTHLFHMVPPLAWEVPYSTSLLSTSSAS